MWLQYYETDTDWRIVENATKDHCEILCQWAGFVADDVRVIFERLEPKHELAAIPAPSAAAVQPPHTEAPPPNGKQQQPPPTEGALTPKQDLARKAVKAPQEGAAQPPPAAAAAQSERTTDPPPITHQQEPPPTEGQLVEVTAGLGNRINTFPVLSSRS